MELHTVIALGMGFLLDCLFGDPYWFPHIIRLYGTLIAVLERILRPVFPKSPQGELWGGAVLVFVMVLVAAGIPFLVLLFCYHLHMVLGLMAETFFCYQFLAAKSLRTESKKVYDCLVEKDLTGAKQAVSMIVGRDTEGLDMDGVTRAAVETVAENTSDGVIAPLFYMALGGAVLGSVYKAVNTMDSMIGYKNAQYFYWGRAAARLDDVLNYIPARLTAWLMLLAAALSGCDVRRGFRIYRRDKCNHASPNSAHGEAVCAGVLGIQLAGNAYYFGRLYQKPTIGDSIRPIVPQDILRANRLMMLTTIEMLCIILAVNGVL